MNTDSLAKLLDIAGPPIGGPARELPPAIRELAGPLATGLTDLLSRKNGCYAFESALHVFPVSPLLSEERSLETWNSSQLWVSDYDGLADGCLFFAEDIFGGQFCITATGISTFDPETGELQLVAKDIADWAAVILDDYETQTGYPLAHEWQRHNGPISPDRRLIPRTPFVLGGEFAVENLQDQDSVTGMRSRADLARQLKGLPDRSQVRFKIID